MSSETYINLIQHEDGVEFDLCKDGNPIPPQLVVQGDTYHGTYRIPKTFNDTMTLLQALLASLDDAMPAKAQRKKVQKALAKYSVPITAIH